MVHGGDGQRGGYGGGGGRGGRGGVGSGGGPASPPLLVPPAAAFVPPRRWYYCSTCQAVNNVGHPLHQERLAGGLNSEALDEGQMFPWLRTLPPTVLGIVPSLQGTTPINFCCIRTELLEFYCLPFFGQKTV